MPCRRPTTAAGRARASKGKGKGKGRGSGGRWRSSAGHGKGAVAVYLEDNQAWGLDGAFVSTVTADALDYDEHKDEQAHTALVTRAAGAGSSSDYDGDSWMDQLGDNTAFLADTINVTTITSSSGIDGNSSDSGSSDYARAANYVDGCDSDTGSDSEPGASSSAMPMSNYGNIVPADGVYDGDMPQRRIGIYDGDDEPDGDYEPYYPPATDNPANFWTVHAPVPDKPDLDERATQTATIDLGRREPRRG